jgi:hypothetical protein
MMRFGIALDRASRDDTAVQELADKDAALTGSASEAMLGTDAAASMKNLVAVLKASANAPPLDQASVTAIDVAVARLDNSLLGARLPYFVDATVMTDLRGAGGKPRRIILLSEFSIAESNLYSSDEGALVRTVRVRRLDRLTFRHGSLGFVNPNRAQATVLLDVVDDQVSRHLLPALSDGAPMPLGASDALGVARAAPPLAELAARAGENAREELGALPAASIRDVFADSIERHEVQHRLDLKHASSVAPLSVPSPVSALIRGDGQRADDLRDAVTSELSGYVSQLARDDRMPRTSLSLLLRFLVNPRTRSSTEAYVARITAEELCRILAIEGVAPLVHDGKLDEERLVRAHRELTSVPEAELTAAASTVWSQLFGRKLPTLKRAG